MRAEGGPEKDGYGVVYSKGVVDFMIGAITSRRVYEKVDSYRQLLSAFPEIGTPYHPEYAAARPPFPCRSIPVPDTPFTIYYGIDHERRTVEVFYMEHQNADPAERFSWECISF